MAALQVVDRELRDMSLLARLSETLQTQTQRLRNRPFLEASMAASALVATADGVVTFSERSALDAVLTNIDALKVFDVHLAVNTFNDFVEAIEADSASGQAKAMDAIGRLRDDPESAALMIRIGCAVSRADGDFSAAEKACIRAMAAELDVEAPELDM